MNDSSDDHEQSEDSLSRASSGVPGASFRRRNNKRLGLLGVIVLAGLATAALLTFWTRPYYALAPGSVRDTASRISITGATLHEPDGEIGFVTVSLTERVNTFEYIRAKMDGSIDLVHEDLINRGRTPDEKREEDRRRMAESKDVATLVALAHLGYEIVPIGLGVEVIGLTPCMPAEQVLEPRDVIVGIDDEIVEFPDDLTGPLQDLEAGDEIELQVNRADDGEIETVAFELGSSADSCLEDEVRTSLEDERAMIGILLDAVIDFDLPIDVAIDTDRVGGPSAGLAFTLSLIDVLTSGELTGGTKVATTGTIDIDGNVGRVGGVKQKTVAARESGVDILLVPEGEGEAALEFAGEMIVEEVLTLDDALEALSSVGGNSADLPDTPESAAGE